MAPASVRRTEQQDDETALAVAELRDTPEPVSGMSVMSFAKIAVQSGYFPSLESVSQAAVKIVLGREIGVGPVAALRGIYVHKGNIGLGGELMASKIRESGRYDYEQITSTEEVAEIEFFRVVNGQRVIPAPDRRMISKFTIAEAKRAGLLKAGSAWETYPSDLLFWRAMSRGQRRFCPNVFAGNAVYTREELDEIPDSEKEKIIDAKVVALPIPVSEDERAELDRLAGILRWNSGRVDQVLGEKRSASAAIEAMRAKVLELAAPAEKKPKPPEERPAPPAKVDAAGQGAWDV